MEILDLTRLKKSEIKKLEQIKINLLNDYEYILREIYNSNKANLNLYLNSILSRDYALSSLYPNFCYFVLAKELLINNQYSLIVAPNFSVGVLLKNHIKKLGLSTKIQSKTMFEYFKGTIIVNIKNLFFNLIYSMISLSCFSWQRRASLPKDGLILIDTFVVPEEMQSGQYEPRHYDHDIFLDLVPEALNNRVYFAPTILDIFNIKSITDHIIKSEKGNFIFKHDYLMPIDYFFAIFSWINIKLPVFYSWTVRRYKLKPIIKEEYYSNLFSHSSFHGLLNFYFFKRLKQQDIKISRVINWFENQISDRGFNYGVRKYYPKCIIKGYQPFGLYLDHLICTSEEYNAKLVPDQIYVCSEDYLKLIKDKIPNLNVSVISGIRNKNIDADFIYRGFSNNLKLKVYVILPLNVFIARQILKIVNNINFNSNIEIIIQIHPELKPSQLSTNIKSEKYKVVSKPFNEIIINADIIIVNGSSTVIESLAHGKPTIIVNTQNSIFTNNIIPNYAKKIVSLCWNELDIKDAIEQFVVNPKDDKEHYEIGKMVRKNYFRSIDIDSIKKLLE